MREWSPQGIPQSRWANCIKEWATRNLLSLANAPGEITWKGTNLERDLVINLAWYNKAAVQAATQNIEGNLGYLIDPEKNEEWICTFKGRLFTCPFKPNPTKEEVEKVVKTLMTDIQLTNEAVFKKWKPLHRKASPWWNAACSIVTQNLRNAQTTERRGILQARLKGTVHIAKRRWADEYIQKAQLWEVAAWRHGRRLSKVPLLKGANGLVHTHGEVADILSQCFFPQMPPEVEKTFRDDPLPRPTQVLPPFDEKLVGSLLQVATNKSAPGQSGHTWMILKWTWAAHPE